MTHIACLQAVVARRVACFLADDNGATAIEYALVAGGIAVAVAGTVWGLGSTVNSTLYSKIGSAFN